MKVQRQLCTLLLSGFICVGLLPWGVIDRAQAQPPGFGSGTTIFWIEGSRQEVFTRQSSYNCPSGPADTAPDEDTWILVNSATLDATNAKAAIVFGHTFAEQDGVGEFNGIVTFLSRDGIITPSPGDQLVQSKVRLANERMDEHSMTIIGLDTNKDFWVRYQFGEVDFAADETLMCLWGTKIQLLGYIE